MSIDDVIPARMLNEVVYCPRLFSLEHVGGEWEESGDTVAGKRVHRRVDAKAYPIPDPVADVRAAVAEARRINELKIPPPPLVDSPKCPGCSLVGIWLPTRRTPYSPVPPKETERSSGTR